MFAMPRLRLLGALAFGSALAASLALAAFSSSASASHSWNDYHWARTANPFTLKLGDNVSSTWDANLAVASSDWSQSTVLDTMVVSGNVTNLKRCPPTSGRVEVCNARYGGNWLGLATIWISGSHILQGTGKMNDRYFNSEPYNTNPWRQLVMCQEVAHTFGLDHQDEDFDNTNLGTCMDYTSNPEGPPSNLHPNQHDYDELEIIYSHLDSTTTVGSATAASKLPPEANQGTFNSKAEWGRKIKESRNGKLELWKRDFGNGFKLITWVIRP